MKSESMIIEQKSRFGLEETYSNLLAEAKLREWGNPANHDLQQTLAKQGKEVRPVRVIEICKPAYSGAMLEKSDERIVSVMMPCRISVYEKEDGLTYVATINASLLAGNMPASVRDVMVKAAEEVEEIVSKVTAD